MQAFAVDLSAEAFASASHFPLSLEDLLAAGAKALPSAPYQTRLAECTSSAKFQPFVAAVAAKGYYAGVEEGSVEYLERHAKVLSKFLSKVGASSGAADERLAEDKKAEGNACIASKDYAGALRAYGEAIELSSEGPNTHVYLTNRAAAHCYLRNYTEAIADCEAAVALNPSYVKAYSRLGLAHFFLEDYRSAVVAYSKCVELEPDNKASRESLRQTQAKLDEKRVEVAPSSSSAASSSSGMPDLAALLGGGGGLPAGLEAMMANPAIAQMAQEMMKNPAMMQQAMSMMGGAGGKGGPDLAAMAAMMKGLDKK